MTHTRFILTFTIALYAICNTLNIDRIARWFRAGEGVDFWGLVAFLAGGLCLFIAVFTLLAHRWSLKPAAILLTVLSAVATYFIGKYGVAIDSSMVRNAIHTDALEVSQLLSPRMIPYVVFLIIAPVILIVRTRIEFGSWRYLLRSAVLFLLALSIGVGTLYSQINSIVRAGTLSNKYIVYSLVPINVISASVNATVDALQPWFRTEQRQADIQARVSSPGNLVVVLAVGESSRRKSFSLYGYTRRDTTPVLRAIDGLHSLNGIATRASTLYALPKILEKDGVKLTTIVSKADVDTVCYVHYTLYDNCAAVGESEVRDCGHGGQCFDEDVLPLLKQDLSTYQSGYRFIVLHFGGGSHGPSYDERIPPEFRRFTPTCTDADVANRCTIDQIYNSYDNTILYVDSVVGRAIRILDAAGVRYVFVYLSDHGESLMENGVLFHGVPPGMPLPPEQAEIPLLVKSSVPIAIARRNDYQQGDVFDSVLELFSIQSTFDRAGSFITLDP